MTGFTRRQFAVSAAAMGAALAWSSRTAFASARTWTERRDLYPEGVASGDPASDSVILWTRRPAVVGERGGAAAAPRLTMEIAEDEQFSRVVATTAVTPKAENDWTVRVLAARLKPATTYWYRFTDDAGMGSRVGRTRTAPADNDERPVTFAFVSCQNHNLGYNNAYRRMMYEDAKAPEGEQLAFVLHLGDFFYELVWYPEDKATYYARHVRDVVRYPNGRKIADYHIPTDLGDYRTVFRSYLADPDLQDARARWPFICMWDNHEFSWRGHQAMTTDDGKVTVGAQTRKVASTQAWFEYQPSRAAKRGDPDPNRYDAPHVVDADVKTFDANGLGQEPNNLAAIHALRAYRSLRFGRNVDLIVTDNRSFRSDPVDNDPRAAPFGEGDFLFPQHVLEILDAGAAYNGGNPPATIAWNGKEIANWRKDEQPKTMLGAEQKVWFLERLRTSQARWKIWGNSVGSLDSRFDFARLPPDLGKGWGGGYGLLTTDDWSGYRYERGEILDHAKAHGITGLVSVCGDRHAYFAGVLSKALPPDGFDPVAIEFVTGSISAPNTCESFEYKFPMDNPQHALYLRKPAGALVQNTINLTIMHGVEASLAFDKSGDLAAAKAQGNKDVSPHLSFVDWGGHGYTVVRAAPDALTAEFVGIPRPIERSASDDGGPLVYRVQHRAKLWSAGERPVLEQTVVEGEAAMST